MPQSLVINAHKSGFTVVTAAEVHAFTTIDGALGFVERNLTFDPPSHFSVVLRSYGPRKIMVVREVRKAFGVGLKTAKEMVEECDEPIGCVHLGVLPAEDALDFEKAVNDYAEDGTAVSLERV